MSAQDDCIFCRIAAGEIPSDFLYEDDLVVAFPDISPLAPVHVLVVPKEHYENIMDDVPAETLSALAHAIGIVAEKTGIDKTGFRCIANTGDDGGQTVHHLHIHVLGGRPLDPNAGEGK
ncbi:histidine triad nucleotide-binding protein [Olsenella urininfantis]|uniref:histidine triad nucleotide-binding protein n=1 Tax=Olsenella urininfantis TaxID=1871033 RepID=UPI0009847889|nr:histidine triad nucleotide-binding protein [Olsenella urininfantis]